MLHKNLIRPSHSPYLAPLWVVQKNLDASDKTKWRLVINYKKVNETTRNEYR